MDTVSYGQEFFDPLGLIMKSEEEMEEGMNGAQNKGGIPQKSLSSNLQLFKQTLHHLVCMIDKCIDYAKEAAVIYIYIYINIYIYIYHVKEYLDRRKRRKGEYFAQYGRGPNTDESHPNRRS